MDLATLLDRPIAFHRAFVALTGSINSALMLSQAFYWSNRATEPDGSFYKSRDEWQDETGLTHEQQESARKRLRGMGFWIERNERISHKVFYRIEVSILKKALFEIPVSRNRETRFGQAAKDGAAEPQKMVSYNRAETTTENTSTSIGSKFTEFWSLYPKKIAKGAAEKAFKKFQKDQDAIIAGLQKQLPVLKALDPQFIPYPATWLNGHRWLDEPTTPNGKTKTHQQARPVSAANDNCNANRVADYR